ANESAFALVLDPTATTRTSGLFIMPGTIHSLANLDVPSTPQRNGSIPPILVNSRIDCLAGSGVPILSGRREAERRSCRRVHCTTAATRRTQRGFRFPGP